MDLIDQAMTADDVVAVLGREVTVRLLNISGSGCLVESSSHVSEGTTGSLTVAFGGREYSDDIRINRCQEIPGSSRYRLGAEFLWTTRPGPRSLRWLIASFKTVAAKACSSIEDRT